MSQTPPERCRLVLIVPPGLDAGETEARLADALSGGDSASLILPQYGQDEDEFQKLAARLVPLAQAAGVAAVIAGEPRIAARVQADGVHFEGSREELAELVSRLGGRMIVGTGGATTRDDALQLGEAEPDYLLFGRFGYDTRPEPHPRSLKLGAWWSQMVTIPAIVLAGTDVDSVAAVADSGAEFVALSAAVFAAGADAAAAVAAANTLLDARAAARRG